MPTYVYKFVETGETIEVQQAFTDATLTELAHPGSGEVLPVKKVFTPVGVTFRGSGFFKTDNREKAAKSESGPSKDGATKDATVKDSTKSSSTSDGAGGSTSGGSKDGGSSSSTPSPAAKTDSSSSTKPASTSTPTT